LFGLALTEKETKLFPPTLISPRYSVGLMKPKHIITYQLNVSNCPHLDNTNRCSIYSKRPIICRSFPVVLGKLTPDCRVFAGIKENSNVPVVTSSVDPLLEAAKEFDKYVESHFRKHFVSGVREWFFDLESKRWLPKTLKLTE
jgi:Fe-S-cluster containining protein